MRNSWQDLFKIDLRNYGNFWIKSMCTVSGMFETIFNSWNYGHFKTKLQYAAKLMECENKPRKKIIKSKFKKQIMKSDGSVG